MKNIRTSRRYLWIRIGLILLPPALTTVLFERVLEANHATTVIRGPGATPTPTPFRPPEGLAFTRLPAVLEAELFDVAPEGIGYHDSDPSNRGGAFRPSDGVDIKAVADGGGYYVTQTVAGEWLAYTVDVESTGAYTLQVRVASAGPGGSFHIELAGSDVSGPLTIPDTGGAESWFTITRTVNLSFSTNQKLRIVLDTNGPSGSVGNFNYLSFTHVRPPATNPPPTAAPGATSTATPTGSMRVASSYRWIPGTFEVEDFEKIHEDTGYFDTDPANLGGQYRPEEAVDIERTTDLGGGYDVAWTKAGEWMEYAWANPSRSGHYVFRVRVASAGPGGQFHLESGGVDVTGTMSVPDTGGAQRWVTLSRTVSLVHLLTKLRLVMDVNGPGGFVGGFGSFSFDPSADTAPTPPGSTPTPTSTITPTPTSTPTSTEPPPVPRPRPRPTSIPSWQAWTWYSVGSPVTYDGVRYQCLQAHKSQPDWTPPNVPALWQRQ